MFFVLQSPVIKKGAFIASLLMVLIFLSDRDPAASVEKQQPEFSIENIEGIEWVVEELMVERSERSERSKKAKREKTEIQNPIIAAVLPHHTLIAKDLNRFWFEITESRKNVLPSVIVIVGPAHENQGQGLLQTTRGTWQTPFGNVKTDDALVSAIVQSSLVREQPQSFENEHSIGTHVSYLATYFPNVPIVPIIAQSSAGEREAQALVHLLDQELPETALIVSSVDFSHYLTVAEADNRDEELRSLIQARAYSTIDGLNTDYLDSPFGLEFYLLWSDRHKAEPSLIWHENSGRIMGDLFMPTTSYLVFFSMIH